MNLDEYQRSESVHALSCVSVFVNREHVCVCLLVKREHVCVCVCVGEDAEISGMCMFDCEN